MYLIAEMLGFNIVEMRPASTWGTQLANGTVIGTIGNVRPNRPTMFS